MPTITNNTNDLLWAFGGQAHSGGLDRWAYHRQQAHRHGLEISDHVWLPVVRPSVHAAAPELHLERHTPDEGEPIIQDDGTALVRVTLGKATAHYSIPRERTET